MIKQIFNTYRRNIGDIQNSTPETRTATINAASDTLTAMSKMVMSGDLTAADIANYMKNIK